MGDVVQIGAVNPAKSDTPPEHEYVWTCAQCGGQSFQLLSTGITCCCRCAWRSDSASEKADTHWRSHLPDLPLNFADIPPLDLNNVITDHKPTPLILRGFAKTLITSDDPVAVPIVRREGGMRMWSEGCETEEQRDWFKERLEGFAEFLLRLNCEPEKGSANG